MIDTELKRRHTTPEMIASENFAPCAVMEAQGSVLTNTYAESHPGRLLRKTARNTREPGRLSVQPAGPFSGVASSPPAGCSDPAERPYFSQASTLMRLASTHFFAAASGAILSTAMYLATVFWSSFVQVKFFTRS
jgi:hypothetical protein